MRKHIRFVELDSGYCPPATKTIYIKYY